MCKKCPELALLVLSLASLPSSFALAQPKDAVQLVGVPQLQESALALGRELMELGFNDTFHDDEDDLHYNETGQHDDDEHHDDEEHHDDDEHQDEEEYASAQDKPWGEVILASLLINLVTLTGVVFITGEFVAKHVFKRPVVHTPQFIAFTHNVVPSFACGALLATTVFLILPESLTLIASHFASADGHDDHGHRSLEEEEEEEEHNDGPVAWRFGTCVIAGFLLPILTTLIFPHSHDVLNEEDSHGTPTEQETEKLQNVPEEAALEQGVEEGHGPSLAEEAGKSRKLTTMVTGSIASNDGSDIIVSTEDKVLAHAVDWPLVTSIMAGDFFHNFAGTFFLPIPLARYVGFSPLTRFAFTV